MPLNNSTGNMYKFVTHTWNTVKGECPHQCSYCYMAGMRKRFNQGAKPPYLDAKEFKTDLGDKNFIFVGSSNDLFAEDHPDDWRIRTLDYCNRFDNRYLFQTKNPNKVLDYLDHPVIKNKSVICTTMETNRWVPDVMGKCPTVYDRMGAMHVLCDFVPTYVTVEPVMDFDPYMLIDLIKQCKPQQVNIGADSGHNKLPEPTPHLVNMLIDGLSEFTRVNQKDNLKRLLK